MEMDIIIESLTWEEREEFPYETFRDALAGYGFTIRGIRFAS